MRGALVFAFMLVVIVYAHRDWFVALCGVVAFTALCEYPGLPNPFEARGVNHWSVMLAGVAIAWLLQHAVGKGGQWERIPRGWWVAIGVYLALELIAITRLCVDLETFKQRASLLRPGYAFYHIRAVIVDQIYAPARYLLIGLLLMAGAQSRSRLVWGMWATLLAIIGYALIIDKEIPLGSLGGGGMEYRDRVHKWTGRHPNDIAQNLAAGFWALLAVVELRVGPRWTRLVALPAAGAVLLALAHTYSRSGFLAWVAVGLVMAALLRSWRPLAVVVGLVAAVAFWAPSVTTRVFTGVDTQGSTELDMKAVSAGRNIIWPAALGAISDSPVIGYGRDGYVRSRALFESIENGGGEGHPHNALLEAALDHGVPGAILLLTPFAYVLVSGAQLARRDKEVTLQWIGISGVAAVISTIVTGLGGEHIILCENLWLFWCIAGLVVAARAYCDEAPAEIRHWSRKFRDRFSHVAAK